MNTQIRQDLNKIEMELNTIFVERKVEIAAIIRTILSKQHMCMIGAPGIAKSALVDALSAKISGSKFFDTLMRRDSTCDELFGPVSLKGLEQDHYLRNISDMLPEADYAFLDEGFKANSTVLNGVLKIMNERKFKNNSQTLTCPLKSMFIASNEMPQSEDLNAFWDRALVRVIVKDIQEDTNFMIFLEGKSGRGPASKVQNTTITLQDLEAAIAEVEAVKVPQDVCQSIVALRRKLHAEGIKPSPRRFAECLKYAKAEAWLDGRDEVSSDDLPVLEHCLWEVPEQQPKVAQILSEVASPDLGRVLELIDSSKEQYDSAINSNNPSQVLEANTKLRKAFIELQKLSKSSSGKAKSKAEAACEQVRTWNNELLKKVGVQTL